MTLLTPPIKWHGGKHYLAARIVALMPPHVHFVEPFAGGLAVLLAKEPEGVSEVVNDLNFELSNFWRVIREPESFERFRRFIEATPFSEVEWRDAGCPDLLAEPWRRAVSFFIRCRQSLAGRMNSFAPLSRTRTRRGMNEQASAWLTAIEGLPAVHERLRRVVILNRPALEVIAQQDGDGTLHYLDPPYVHETRAAAEVYGDCEMSADDHGQLLATLRQARGKVMLSGYRCKLYDRELARWLRHDFELPNNAAAGDSKRRMIESLWMNWR
jgi:DNA adenine methylase